MKSFNSVTARLRRAKSDSELRYISKYANPVSPHAPYRTQVMHIAGNFNYTLCGRQLSDPYTVFSSSGHKLCAQCESKRANS